MIYIPRLDDGPYKDALTDIATALAIGTVEIELTPFYNGTDNVIRTSLKLTSDIRPSNGSNQRTVIMQDDNDRVVFIPTEGKAVRGNIFVALRDTTYSELGTDTNNAIETYLNDIRQICNQTNAVLTNAVNIVTDVSTIQSTTYVIAWGYLKETQTEDYNPLSVIDAAWVYKMFNPALIQ